jgi:hypothetical protein
MTRSNLGGTQGRHVRFRWIIIRFKRIYGGANEFATSNLSNPYRSTLSTHWLGMVFNQLEPKHHLRINHLCNNQRHLVLGEKMAPHHGHVNFQYGCLHMFIQTICILGGIFFLMGLMPKNWLVLVNVASPHILRT